MALKAMFIKFVIASAIIMLASLVVIINNHMQLKDSILFSQDTHEYSKIDFQHNDKIIDPKIINYIHTRLIHIRLDHRLSYEDEFKNNIQLSSDEFSTEDTMSYNTLAEVKDNIFLIQTNYHWLWGDYRHSIFLIQKDKEALTLLDYYIPNSTNDPMAY